MRFWLTSLAIFAQFLRIPTAASHLVPHHSPTSIDSTAEVARTDVCLTRECYDTALRINQSMDFTVDPCDNFYQYTCGNLVKNGVIPDDEDVLNVLNSIEDHLMEREKNLLEVGDEKDDIRPFKLTKTLYKSCMNLEAIEAKGVAPLKNFTQARGGWPVLEGDSWNESKFDWMATIAEWSRDGFNDNCFMAMDIKPDVWNRSRHIIYLNVPKWNLPWYLRDKSFDNGTKVKAHYKYMVEIAVLLGADRKRAETELKDATLFQIELNKLIFGSGNSMNPRYDTMTLKELTKRYPSVKWNDTFSRMYSQSQPIGDDEPIILQTRNFIEKVIELISKTPKRVQANFAMWQIMVTLLGTMNQDIRDVQKTYNTAVYGAGLSFPRWKLCVTKVILKLRLGLSAMYVRKFVRPKTEAIIEEIVDEIVQEYQRNFDKVSFLDTATKAFARKKLKAVKKYIGYPKEIIDNGKLENYYRDLELIDDEYFSNMLKISRFKFYKQVEDLRKPIDKNNWRLFARYVLEINAFATSWMNSIMLTAGILQGSMFHSERPRSMNFGTIGALAAHEIGHLFDGKGREYDENGDRKDWWMPATKKAFDKEALCFIYQYGNYTENTLKVNLDGSRTLNENIADNGGAKRAYHAYLNSMRGKAPDKRLPGLDFTPNQLFWIARGSMLCTKYRSNNIKLNILTDTHSLPEYRSNGPLSNSKEFAEDFNCPVGSKMNPVKKCSIW